jgi:hypothetical protein
MTNFNCIFWRVNFSKSVSEQQNSIKIHNTAVSLRMRAGLEKVRPAFYFTHLKIDLPRCIALLLIRMVANNELKMSWKDTVGT